MFEEYEVVKLRRDMPSVNLKAGDRGAIVMVYVDPSQAYEVEFTDKEGKTIALLTLKEEDIEKA
jgi:hypothetical protein